MATGFLSTLNDREWGGPGDDETWWSLVLLPFVAGAVGYVTNVIALKMTFYPLEFWGVKIWQPPDQPFGFFGWQGIIPAKAGKMAAKSVDLMTEKLIDVQEVFNRIEPAMFAKVMEPGLFLMMDEIVNSVARNRLPPGVWDSLPEAVRHESIFKALDDSPGFLSNFMSDMKADVNRYFDLKNMVVTNMVANKGILNKVFLTCGKDELVFIERSGFYFGFLFGLGQMVWWYFYQAAWVLPACGFVVGFATNWLALKVIFLPIEPKKVCGITLHGLFLRRQQHVAKVYAKITADEILTPPAMWDAILHGNKREEFTFLLRSHTHAFVDEMAGKLKPLIERSLGPQAFHAMKDDIADQIVTKLPGHIGHSYAYTEKALRMEHTLHTAMAGLTFSEFEGVLHPVFEEDELKLIVVGAVLGLTVGILQYIVVFGG